MALQPPMLNFVTPQPVKVDAIAQQTGMGRQQVRRAMDWLVASGYIVEHKRAERRVRVLTLAWAVAERAAPSSVVAATLTAVR